MHDNLSAVFISYSRRDVDFVDRLEADLQARSVPTWVDRKKLQGGQEWQDQIQGALDTCRVVLVVLTPEAVDSRNARVEYRYALSIGKPVIPLLLRPCPRVPMYLNDLQWVLFDTDYDKGLQDLLVALANLPAPSSAVARPVQLAPDEGTVDLVVSHPAPRSDTVDLAALYREGVKARTEGDLEHAAVAWQQVLTAAPDFGGGSLATQMRALNQELRPARIIRLRQRAEAGAREGAWGQVAGTWKALVGIDPMNIEAQEGLRSALRAQAERANQQGLWQEEISAWEALLQLEPQDAQALERLPVATQNRQSAWHYDNARQFVKDGDAPSARAELQTLWKEAPYYCDPEGLSAAVGLVPPPSFETAKSQRQQAAVAAEEANRRSKVVERQRSLRRTLAFSITSAVVVIVLAGSLVLAGAHNVGPLSGIIGQKPTATPTPIMVPTPPPGWAQYQAPDGSFGYNYPSDWTQRDVSNPPTVPVNIGYYYSQPYTVIAVGDLLDPTGQYSSPQGAANGVVQFARGLTGNSNLSFYPIPANGVTISGLPWNAFTANFLDSGHEISLAFDELERAGKLYFIVSLAPPDLFSDLNTSVFQPVINSFRFLK